MGDTTSIAIACQGGGSHTAFTAGALRGLLPRLTDAWDLVGLSGTSGGALCATTAWYGLLADDEDPVDLLASLWDDLAARTLPELFANDWARAMLALEARGAPMPSFS